MGAPANGAPVPEVKSQHVSASTADAPYWRALSEGRLTMQRCQGCSHWHWPAVSRCSECGAWDPPWQDVPIEGAVFSWATTWHPFGGTEAIGVPYTTVLVALPHADNRRLLGLWEGEEGELSMGAAVVGSVGATMVGKTEVPSLRWRLAR